MVALTAAAMATTNLRLATAVLAVDFRHPLVLAKELATLDVISEGRVEVGLGAGWYEPDYAALGVTKDPTTARLERVAHAVAVMRAAWSDDADGFPPPYQRPIPITLGGAAPRSLRLAGALGDAANIALDGSALARGDAARGLKRSLDESIAWLREGAGNQFPDLPIGVRVAAAEVTNDASAALARRAALLNVDPEDLAASPHVLVGTQSYVEERIAELAERWRISSLVCNGQDAWELASLVASVGDQG
jgi:probable F420-dependent oxidoreductase